MSSNKDKLRAWKAENPPPVVPKREEMVAALKIEVIPLIRKYGFSGTFPHYRRIGSTKTDCVTFQFDKYGGGFVVEIGEGPADVMVTPWGEQIPAKKLTSYDLDWARSTRLEFGPPSDRKQWFRYDTGAENACASAARAVLQILPEVEAWFLGDRPQPNIQPLMTK